MKMLTMKIRTCGCRLSVKLPKRIPAYSTTSSAFPSFAENKSVSKGVRRPLLLCKKQFLLPHSRKFSHSSCLLQNQSNLKVTMQNVFSDENKARVMKELDNLPTVRHVKVVEDPRKAGVLIIMCKVGGEPGLLYMKRSDEIKKHRGEICFPGGMVEPSDEDIIHTALRETKEEIGLDVHRDQVWGTMQPVPGRDGRILTTPVVAFTGGIDMNDLTLDKREVDSIFVENLATLCDPRYVKYTTYRYGTRGFTLPVFIGGRHRVWGLTAVITHMYLSVLAPGLYTFKLTQTMRS